MSSSRTALSNARKTDSGPNAAGPVGKTALDGLLAVLRTPALASGLSLQEGLWSEIKRVAAIHRFSGWLASAASPWLPPSERPWRDRILIEHHQRHRQFLNQLRIFSEAFLAERIPCVFLKGPLLAERVHAVPFLKLSRDLDLLVRCSDIPAAARLMQRLSFRLIGDFPWPLHRRYAHHLNFEGTADVRTVDLHYVLKAGPRLISADEFMDRAVGWRSADGSEYQVLSPPDEVFYLIVHAAGHAFHRLRWLYDALAAAKTLDAAGRARVRSLAIETGQTGDFVGADMACREFFGEALPLDLSGFKRPWLWSPLQPRHLRTMAQRSDYRFILRALDVCRMSGSPVSALHLCAQNARGRLALRLYRLRGGATGPDVLASTIRQQEKPE